jgi:UDP-N-acetylmuramyl pentapeptide phosphotransferase/UDP-N-acetylglucosamine-1-phosphate transferase
MSGYFTVAPWADRFVFAVLAAAAAISFILLSLLRPLLARHALAHPNARSSHKTPTPHGAAARRGGFSVVACPRRVGLPRHCWRH